MERFKLMVSLFLAQHHGRKLSDIFGVEFDDAHEWVVDTRTDRVRIRINSSEAMNMKTLVESGWCCVYIDDLEKVSTRNNILEFWWGSLTNACCVNYFTGKTSDTVDIIDYISLEDKI